MPWITQVQSYPTALRTYTMVKRAGEGSAEGDDSIDLPTREGQHIRQDISITYNTTQEKAAEVFKAFRGADISDIEVDFHSSYDDYGRAKHGRPDVAFGSDFVQTQ